MEPNYQSGDAHMSRSRLGCVYIVFLFILFIIESWGWGEGKELLYD